MLVNFISVLKGQTGSRCSFFHILSILSSAVEANLREVFLPLWLLWLTLFSPSHKRTLKNYFIPCRMVRNLFRSLPLYKEIGIAPQWNLLFPLMCREYIFFFYPYQSSEQQNVLWLSNKLDFNLRVREQVLWNFYKGCQDAML